MQFFVRAYAVRTGFLFDLIAVFLSYKDLIVVEQSDKVFRRVRIAIQTAFLLVRFQQEQAVIIAHKAILPGAYRGVFRRRRRADFHTEYSADVVAHFEVRSHFRGRRNASQIAYSVRAEQSSVFLQNAVSVVNSDILVQIFYVVEIFCYDVVEQDINACRRDADADIVYFAVNKVVAAENAYRAVVVPHVLDTAERIGDRGRRIDGHDILGVAVFVLCAFRFDNENAFAPCVRIRHDNADGERSAVMQARYLRILRVAVVGKRRIRHGIHEAFVFLNGKNERLLPSDHFGIVAVGLIVFDDHAVVSDVRRRIFQQFVALIVRHDDFRFHNGRIRHREFVVVHPRHNGVFVASDRRDALAVPFGELFTHFARNERDLFSVHRRFRFRFGRVQFEVVVVLRFSFGRAEPACRNERFQSALHDQIAYAFAVRALDGASFVFAHELQLRHIDHIRLDRQCKQPLVVLQFDIRVIIFLREFHADIILTAAVERATFLCRKVSARAERIRRFRPNEIVEVGHFPSCVVVLRRGVPNDERVRAERFFHAVFTQNFQVVRHRIERQDVILRIVRLYDIRTFVHNVSVAELDDVLRNVDFFDIHGQRQRRPRSVPLHIISRDRNAVVRRDFARNSYVRSVDVQVCQIPHKLEIFSHVLVVHGRQVARFHLRSDRPIDSVFIRRVRFGNGRPRPFFAVVVLIERRRGNFGYFIMFQRRRKAEPSDSVSFLVVRKPVARVFVVIVFERNADFVVDKVGFEFVRLRAEDFSLAVVIVQINSAHRIRRGRHTRRFASSARRDRIVIERHVRVVFSVQHRVRLRRNDLYVEHCVRVDVSYSARADDTAHRLYVAFTDPYAVVPFERYGHLLPIRLAVRIVVEVKVHFTVISLELRLNVALSSDEVNSSAVEQLRVQVDRRHSYIHRVQAYLNGVPEIGERGFEFKVLRLPSLYHSQFAGIRDPVALFKRDGLHVARAECKGHIRREFGIVRVDLNISRRVDKHRIFDLASEPFARIVVRDIVDGLVVHKQYRVPLDHIPFAERVRSFGRLVARIAVEHFHLHRKRTVIVRDRSSVSVVVGVTVLLHADLFAGVARSGKSVRDFAQIPFHVGKFNTAALFAFDIQYGRHNIRLAGYKQFALVRRIDMNDVLSASRTVRRRVVNIIQSVEFARRIVHLYRSAGAVFVRFQIYFGDVSVFVSHFDTRQFIEHKSARRAQLYLVRVVRHRLALVINEFVEFARIAVYVHFAEFDRSLLAADVDIPFGVRRGGQFGRQRVDVQHVRKVVVVRIVFRGFKIQIHRRKVAEHIFHTLRANGIRVLVSFDAHDPVRFFGIRHVHVLVRIVRRHDAHILATASHIFVPFFTVEIHDVSQNLLRRLVFRFGNGQAGFQFLSDRRHRFFVHDFDVIFADVIVFAHDTLFEHFFHRRGVFVRHARIFHRVQEVPEGHSAEHGGRFFLRVIDRSAYIVPRHFLIHLFGVSRKRISRHRIVVMLVLLRAEYGRVFHVVNRFLHVPRIDRRLFFAESARSRHADKREHRRFDKFFRRTLIDVIRSRRRAADHHRSVLG